MLTAALALMIGMAGAPAHKVSGHKAGASRPVASKAAARPKGMLVVGGSPESGVVLFVNLDTVQATTARTYRFWYLTVMSRDRMREGMKYIKTYIEISCPKKTSRTLSTVAYDLDGEVLITLPDAKPFQHIVPDTQGATLYSRACESDELANPEPDLVYKDTFAALTMADMAFDAAADEGDDAGAARAGGSPDDFVERGLRDIEANRADSAVANFDRAIALGSRDKVAFLGRAMARFHTGDLDGARADYGQAIALDPSDAGSYAARAQFLQADEDYANAIRDASRAIELSPDLVSAYDTRGAAYIRTKQYALAYADFDLALKLDAEDVDAWSGRGAANLSLENYEAALKDYDRAVALRPDRDEVYVERGTVYLIIRNYDAALADLDKAIALNPGNAEAVEIRKIAVMGKAGKTAPNDPGSIG